MLNEQSQIVIKRPQRVRDAAPAVGSLKRSGEAYDYNVKSATRALEVIELFGVHRHPLSVTEIANALGIPQSSSSVLLHALSSIGFVTRDRKTRKQTDVERVRVAAPLCIQAVLQGLRRSAKSRGAPLFSIRSSSSAIARPSKPRLARETLSRSHLAMIVASKAETVMRACRIELVIPRLG
jgi:hypothetical protein